ncbi:T9SS type A sorting domain-containing protein [Bacteroidales bacterium OttesenSCG-928-K03]|nr:T9SS type A sorting domain-containing protein [Odoribacter sp. OttesenSCG-928-L07]MDL2238788.1 T9SS type A sorting domain-containing protein [Bacteroidales bacterium OttesenSCG-928-L14]MDL2242167.1 T9SS type A sorting domain-containing protein [Bacteroidales bacterium OttesenSCG-928-K03]
MKKFLSISIILIISVSSLFAQEILLNKNCIKTGLPLEIITNILELDNFIFEKSEINTKDEWWEPDTIWIYSSIDTKRELYEYNDQGSITKDLVQVIVSEEWINESQIKYLYENNNLIEQISQEWSENTFVNSSSTSLTYNNNLLTSVTLKTWENNAWLNNYLIEITYNGENMSSGLVKTWDNGWTDYIKITASYDNNNNVIGANVQAWAILFWLDVYKATLAYDNNNNLTEVTLQEFSLTASWTYTEKYIMDYTNTNKLQSTITQSWENNAWLNGTATYLEYDSDDRLIAETYDEWNEGNWIHFNYTEYLYDDLSDNISEVIYKSWENNEWVNSSRNTNVFSQNNNSLLAEFWCWENEDWIVCDGDITLYYNADQSSLTKIGNKIVASYPGDEPVVGIEDLTNQDKNIEICIYPNPAIDKINISANNCEIKSVVVFNQIGQKVKQTNALEIGISDLPSGIYILQINTDKGIVNEKVLKQ